MSLELPLAAVTKPVPAHGLLSAPIPPTLLRLAVRNAVAMVGTALIAITETTYIGRLGLAPLAGTALVFPFAMLAASAEHGVDLPPEAQHQRREQQLGGLVAGRKQRSGLDAVRAGGVGDDAVRAGDGAPRAHHPLGQVTRRFTTV